MTSTPLQHSRTNSRKVSNFILTVLGTASAVPIADRNPSAQVLNVHGRLFLIDCGEGTQQQFRRLHLSFLKVEAIFLSHIHGDHCLGIFGLLSTMSMYGRTQPLRIFAPRAFGPILKFYQSYFGADDTFQVEHVVLDAKEPQEILSVGELSVSAFPLRHKIECYGFGFTYRGNYAYAYCSDTAPFPELSTWVKGVKYLYHECTYTREHAEKAVARYHSVTDDAARCALEAGAERLVIGHYSSRVRDLSQFQRECQETFLETVAANDGDVFEIY